MSKEDETLNPHGFVNTKYKFTGQTKTVNGHVLHRIVAIKDFGHIKAGTVGGYIESCRNLSPSGDAWVCKDAMIYGPNTQITENAIIGGKSVVCGPIKISGCTKISGKCRISCKVPDFYNSLDQIEILIWGNTTISGDCKISGRNIRICNTTIDGTVEIKDNTHVLHDSSVSGIVKLTKANIVKTSIGPGQITIIDTIIEYSTISGNQNIDRQPLISCKTLQ